MQASERKFERGPSNATTTLSFPLSPEDQARADFYGLIACLLFKAPDADLLLQLAQADSLVSNQSDNPLDHAWEMLVSTAGIVDEYVLADEFNALFVSAGSPQVNPYASVYLAGFLNGKPLAALRSRLMSLGLTRMPGAVEMEDHLSAICEAMRLLITGGEHGAPQSTDIQREFFEQYLWSWAERCLDDIAGATGANFYRNVAGFTKAFLSIELQAFEFDEVAGGERIQSCIP